MGVEALAIAVLIVMLVRDRDLRAFAEKRVKELEANRAAPGYGGQPSGYGPQGSEYPTQSFDPRGQPPGPGSRPPGSDPPRS
jgi:hypothetical protein